METGNQLKVVAALECDCCVLAEDAGSRDYGCAQRGTVFTEREQRVLKRIREASAHAGLLRERIKVIEGESPVDTGAREAAREEYEILRALRSELEKERVAAAEERMRLLGHA